MSDPTGDLLARIQRLEDIEAIKTLKHRYFRSIDSADIATLATLVTDDFAVDYKGGTYHWQVTGKDVVLEALANSFHSRGLAQHTGHHPEIEIRSPTAASGLWYLTDTFLHLDTRLLTKGSALYRDTYVKQHDGWKIATSAYTRLYEIVETVPAVPNVTYNILATTGRVKTQ
jgi:hypothetical protein